MPVISATYLPYAATHAFAPLVTDYLAGEHRLNDFYLFRPDEQGIAAAIEGRKQHPVDRQTLVSVLERQYEATPDAAVVHSNIRLLADERTFTICTAHQPNLATGYLYFVYKILHAIKLARDLKEQYPQYNFVPVYYMGSEDNDLEELGTFRYGGQKFVWDAAGQTGAVGRMSTASLKPLLQELFAILGPPGESLDALKDMLESAYIQHPTIADATRHLVHRLFGRYGLITLNADEAALKRSFIPVMEADLFQHHPNRIATETAQALEQAGYGAQAFSRPVNLFYLRDDIRERIEQDGSSWRVVGRDIRWEEAALRAELHAHPERFSPNVILRGLYQETILPDIAFIGGGAEVAYWMQLQGLFQHFRVFYPVLLLRQSVLWIREKEATLRQKAGIDEAGLFLPEADLLRRFVKDHTDKDYTTAAEQAGFEQLLQGLRIKAAAISPTLRSSTDAALTKIKYQLQVLEKKMLRAEKRNMSAQLDRLSRLKAALFPSNSLQERVENFMDYYLLYGDYFFDQLLEAMVPLRNEFLVIEDAV